MVCSSLIKSESEESLSWNHVCIINLRVRDLKRSIRFYRDGLGLSKQDDGDKIAFFITSGTWLALYPWSALA